MPLPHPRLRSALLVCILVLGPWPIGGVLAQVPLEEEAEGLDHTDLPEGDGELDPSLLFPEEGHSLHGSPGVGLVWPGPPVSLGLASRGDPLDGIRLRMEHGDTAGALALAERLAPTLSAREASAAWMLIGMLHRDAGRANLASEAFTEVRTRGGPLGPWGAYHEAEQDLIRGRTRVALGECRSYLERYPKGAHVEECEQLIAVALGRLGEHDAAIAAADAWDRSHAIERIGEQVRLDLADALATTDPTRAIELLRRLTTSFTAPLTTRRAERALAALRRQGHPEAVLPTDVASLQQRAVSLRESGGLDEAWALYSDLAARASTDPSLAAWVDGSFSTFAWRTRRWDALDRYYESLYAEDPNGGIAWSASRAAARGGDFKAAMRWIGRGLSQHADHASWRGQHEVLARTLMLAGAYREAVRQFDLAARGGGHAGRAHALYAAFAAWRAGDDADAVRRLDALISAGQGMTTEARYWRASILGDGPQADEDRAWILSRAPESWYGVLLRQRQPSPEARLRTGRWPESTPEGPAPTATGPLSGPVPVGPIARDVVNLEFPIALAWPPVQPFDLGVAAWSGLDTALVAVGGQPGWRDPNLPPPSYPEGPWFQRGPASALFEQVSTRYGDRWPALLAIQDLARVGLYDLSGPLMNSMYVDWYSAYRRRDARARELARELDGSEWRQLFALSRDHYHIARHAHTLRADPTDLSTALATARLKLPLAHDQQVWRHARLYGLDPYLVLGLMQTESVFNARAVSPVGARGPMQIMPRTGHLLAALSEDETFTAGALHDPVLAVNYGIFYLGLLMERFDGAFPLAVASYNGGPHNVSAWLQGTGLDMPMDVWVEHIPFGETRRYVRLVTERYARYASLWEAHAVVAVPATPSRDDPTVVDF